MILSPRKALGECDALALKRMISGLTAAPTCGYVADCVKTAVITWRKIADIAGSVERDGPAVWEAVVGPSAIPSS